MIRGNSFWETTLASRQKRALYYVYFKQFGFYVTSFTVAGPNAAAVGTAPLTISGNLINAILGSATVSGTSTFTFSGTLANFYTGVLDITADSVASNGQSIAATVHSVTVTIS